MTATVPPPAAESTSAILDAIGGLPPLLSLLAFLLPVLVFVAWGPWSWLAGGLAGAWAAGHFGTDGLLVAAYTFGGLAYLANCRWNPMADCWWCKGGPKRRDKQRHFHWCFVCGGSGRRYRLGAFAWPRYREQRQS